jgi:hypothetical protein
MVLSKYFRKKIPRKLASLAQYFHKKSFVWVALGFFGVAKWQKFVPTKKFLKRGQEKWGSKMITLKEGRLFIVRWPGDWLTALLPALHKRLCALIVAAKSFFFSSSLLVCHFDIAFLRLCSLCRSELFDGFISQRIGIWTQRSFFLSSRVLRIEVYFIRYGELFF